MKRHLSVLIAILMMILAVFGCLCGCDNLIIIGPGGGIDTNIPGDSTGTDNNDDTGNGEDGDTSGGSTEDDNKDDDGKDDDGDNKDEEGKDDGGDKDDKPFASAVPSGTITTVYYTNNGNWTNVYAYLWNYKTQAKKAAWPGEKLTSFGTSGYGEKQFKIDVDYSVYDRIIFNNGSSSQTKDLVVSGATSGYYGQDGTFTMNTDDYGKVTYTTLTDTKNLSYISGGKKKISIYTPPGYTASKKYGVLYMFDGQNLYEAATGSEAERNGAPNRWQTDVAVTSLVGNGGNGLIIVGIDNASSQRDQELTMSLAFGNQTYLGGSNYGSFKNGKLDELGNFIKETVMPYIKTHYSVDASREHTGIAGSSSGGLGAYYLGLRDNDLYGYIGAFSPANGIFENAAWTNFYRNKDFSAGKPKVYVYCGKNDHDLEDMLLPETQKIKTGLTAAGFSASDIIENYVDGGTHNEVYWRVAFPEFLSKMAP